MEQVKDRNFISPFSYHQHTWELQWEIVASSKKFDRPNENRSTKEEKALEAIACVGVIGGLQLKTLFGIGKELLNSMCNRHLLVRHTIRKDNLAIPIYTIGKYGANKIMPEYQSNYWLEMDEVKVLKCLSFFQFCYMLEDVDIIPAPDPFTAGLRMNGKIFYLYIERNGLKDLLLYLKWKERFDKRIFLITEKIDNIEDIEIYMEKEQPLLLRVILDEQLKEREFKIFHYNSNNDEKWIKE